MKIKLKRINKKRPWEKIDPCIVYSKYRPAEITPIIGNWDSMVPMNVKVPRKWFMTHEEIAKQFKGRRYYENKIKCSN